jgi:hypothetical protein
MKKLTLAILLTAAALVGSGPAAHAYPPSGPVVAVTPPTVGPGGSITITITGGTPGQPIIINITINITIVIVVPATGTAVAEVPAPSEPGSYPGVASGPDIGEIPFTVEVDDDPAVAPIAAPASSPDASAAPDGPVAAATLPATGASGIGDVLGTAGGLVVVGIGLASVAHLRRRQRPDHPADPAAAD